MGVQGASRAKTVVSSPGRPSEAGAPKGGGSSPGRVVDLGLGHTVALHYWSTTLYQIREYIRRLFF